MKQRSSEWYEARAGKITGSRFSRAMARKNTAKYKDLIAELVSERVAGRSLDGGYTNHAIQWGIDHEDSAREWYSQKCRQTVHQAGFIVHRKYEFVGVSPDGLVGANGLIEIKCPQVKNFNLVKETRTLPAQYRWQIQGQLWVCQREWSDFVCFYPPKQGVVIRIPADAQDFIDLEERCLEIESEVTRLMHSAKKRTLKSNSLPKSESLADKKDVRKAQRNSTISVGISNAEPKGLSKFSWQSIPWWLWILIVLILISIFAT